MTNFKKFNVHIELFQNTINLIYVCTHWLYYPSLTLMHENYTNKLRVFLIGRYIF